MSLPPKRLGHIIGDRNADLQIEVFLDLMCPFSKKAYFQLKQVQKNDPDRIAFIMHSWIQPWHAQNTWLTQASLAVGIVKPEKVLRDGRSHLHQHREFC